MRELELAQLRFLVLNLASNAAGQNLFVLRGIIELLLTQIIR
jgi:hypothetical protein